MIKPPIKYVGGKTRLLPVILPLLGDLRGKRYYEPCLGGGSVFFALRSLPEAEQPAWYLLSDVNQRLIKMYRGLRDDPDFVVGTLQAMNALLDDEALELFYSRVRESLNKGGEAEREHTPRQVAVLMIALNKLGFNGLYRENKKGEFNVPRGDATSIAFDEDNLRAVSAALAGPVSINACSYQAAINQVWDEAPHSTAESVWFIDPPYLGQYASYTPQGPGVEFHTKLREFCRDRAFYGARVVLCAANNEATREVYGEPTVLGDIQRTVGTTKGKGKRGPCKEAFYVWG